MITLNIYQANIACKTLLYRSNKLISNLVITQIVIHQTIHNTAASSLLSTLSSYIALVISNHSLLSSLEQYYASTIYYTSDVNRRCKVSTTHVPPLSSMPGMGINSIRLSMTRVAWGQGCELVPFQNPNSVSRRTSWVDNSNAPL